MKREDLSKIFIALYAILLIMYVAVIVFDFQKEYFADTYLMNIVVLITLHLVVPFIYSEKYKEGKTVANVVQFLKNPFFIGYFVLSSLYLCKSMCASAGRRANQPWRQAVGARTWGWNCPIATQARSPGAGAAGAQNAALSPTHVCKKGKPPCLICIAGPRPTG